MSSFWLLYSVWHCLAGSDVATASDLCTARTGAKKTHPKNRKHDNTSGYYWILTESYVCLYLIIFQSHLCHSLRCFDRSGLFSGHRQVTLLQGCTNHERASMATETEMDGLFHGKSIYKWMRTGGSPIFGPPLFMALLSQMNRWQQAKQANIVSMNELLECTLKFGQRQLPHFHVQTCHVPTSLLIQSRCVLQFVLLVILPIVHTLFPNFHTGRLCHVSQTQLSR